MSPCVISLKQTNKQTNLEMFYVAQNVYTAVGSSDYMSVCDAVCFPSGAVTTELLIWITWNTSE